MELQSARILPLAHAEKRFGPHLPHKSLAISRVMSKTHFTIIAYRETAVLYAFSAAGVVHAVARACAAGRLRKCHCAEAENEVETRQTWRWGGCGDNLAYAKAFAKKFLDAGPSTSSSSKQRNGKSNADEREEGGGKGDGQKSSIVSGKPKKKKKVAVVTFNFQLEGFSGPLRHN